MPVRPPAEEGRALEKFDVPGMIRRALRVKERVAALKAKVKAGVVSGQLSVVSGGASGGVVPEGALTN
jgi:hypothetical protein